MGQLRIVDLKQGSLEWAIWRHNVLGASRSAALVNMSKFSTPYQTFLEMTLRKPGFEGNIATQRGQEVEDAARSSYEIDQGFIEAKPLCVLHPKYDFIGASLDGYNHDTGIPVEIKYTSDESHLMALKGEVPKHYWIQVQHQLMCLPHAEEAHYYSYRPDGKAIVRVKSNKEFQKNLEDVLIAFWDLVKFDIPPYLEFSDAKELETSEAIEISKKLIFLKSDTSKKSKEISEELKIKLIEIADHPKARVGNVLVSKSKTKTGKYSYRLTVSNTVETEL